MYGSRLHKGGTWFQVAERSLSDCGRDVATKEGCLVIEPDEMGSMCCTFSIGSVWSDII